MSVSVAAHISASGWQLSGSVTAVEQGPIQKKHVGAIKWGSAAMPSRPIQNFANAVHENFQCQPGPGRLTFVRQSDHLSSEIQTALSARRHIQKVTLSLPNGIATLTGVCVAGLTKDNCGGQGSGRREWGEVITLTFENIQWLRHR